MCFGCVDPPSVTVSEKIIHTGPGSEVQIECQFDSNPDVQVQWLRDNIDINFDAETNMAVIPGRTENDDMMSTLKITNLEEDDLGSYTCRGVNSEGTAMETIVLSGM